MGLFLKDKITIQAIANSIASIVFESQSEKSLKQYSILLKEIGENEIISKKQKRELLIFDMFAATIAIQKSFDDSPRTQILLDCFHEDIYKRISNTEKRLIEFEKIMQERYQSYYKILSLKKENMMFSFGRRFTHYFLNHNTTEKELVFVISSEEMFSVTIETIQGFLKEVLVKYKIT